MMKLIYTINAFLKPYRRVLYKVTNFISMAIIFALGFLTGLLLAKYGYIDLGVIKQWVR